MANDNLTQFFAWLTLINYALLLIAWLILLVMKDFVMGLHNSAIQVPTDELTRLYFQFFAFHKVLILTFGLVPYIVLRFIM